MLPYPLFSSSPHVFDAVTHMFLGDVLPPTPFLKVSALPSGNSESESKLWELINRSNLDIMGLATAYRGAKIILG